MAYTPDKDMQEVSQFEKKSCENSCYCICICAFLPCPGMVSRGKKLLYSRDGGRCENSDRQPLYSGRKPESFSAGSEGYGSG